jgi:hypothetical protein
LYPARGLNRYESWICAPPTHGQSSPGVPANPGRPPRARERQGRAQALDARDAREAIGHGIRAKRSNQARSALICSPSRAGWRAPMHRSSKSIGAIATALAKAQAEHTNPEKSLVGTIRSPFKVEMTGPSVCAALDRSRHRPQDSWEAGDCDSSDDID